MKLKALSYYDGDKDTRFGDCILLYDDSTLVVYDCGHSRHSEEVQSFLQVNPLIMQVHIVVSHNDGDHTNGVIGLLDWLADHDCYMVSVHSSLYLKSAKKVLDILDDNRRTLPATKEHILETFDKIKTIVEKAQEYDFMVRDAAVGAEIASCTIVGPTEDEFVEVVAQAIKDGSITKIDGETVMNAASVQMKCSLKDDTVALLCGDASPAYLHYLDGYDIIQLPHHGQSDDAEVVFDKLTNAGSKVFLISDNTGSGSNSGGSDAIMKSILCKGKRIKNTKNKVVDLPEESRYNGGGSITKGGIYVPSTQRTGGYGCDIL